MYLLYVCLYNIQILFINYKKGHGKLMSNVTKVRFINFIILFVPRYQTEVMDLPKYLLEQLCNVGMSGLHNTWEKK